MVGTPPDAFASGVLPTLRLRSPDAAQRVALREAVRCRAGVPVFTRQANRGPGSAKQRQERCIAPGTRAYSISFSHSSSLITFTPCFSASFSFEPAPGPATTRSVFLDTDPDTFA